MPRAGNARNLVLVAACLFAARILAAQPDYRVAFTSFAPLNTDLFIANADGSDAQPFLADSALDSSASFSRDGQWVRFTSRRAGSSDIFRASLEDDRIRIGSETVSRALTAIRRAIWKFT